MDITKIAKAVVAEDMSLKEHDMRYHDNNYRGGPCLVRERMKSGDDSDASIADATQKEAAMYFAKKNERMLVENAVREICPFIRIRNKAGCTVSEADDQGNSKLTIYCKPTVPDEAVDVPLVKKTLKDLGYKCSDMNVLVKKPEEGKTRFEGAITDRKEFVFDIQKQGKFRMADSDTGNDLVTRIPREESTLGGDEGMSEMLKRYGLKSEGGKVVKRTMEDDRDENLRKYLNIVGM